MSSTNRTARSRHWDGVYGDRGIEGVSWFQAEPAVSLELLDQLPLDPAAPILDLGGGASRLVDRLLARGHHDVTVLDTSIHALHATRRRLGEQASAVRWESADLLTWEPPRTYQVWHDRAVFHFLTEPEQQDRYRKMATKGITPGGYLLLGTFAADGPDHCSGLPVTRYTPAQLAEQFRSAFTVVATRREHHHTPTGTEQPFTWLLARRAP